MESETNQMNDDEMCEVKLSRRTILKVVGSFLVAVFYSVKTVPTALDQLSVGSLDALKVLFFVFALAIVFFILLVIAKWRVRITSKSLQLLRNWGWQKYRWSDVELDPAWKNRLVNAAACRSWLEDRSDVVLQFIGGRTVKISSTYYVPKYEIKFALLRVLAQQELGTSEGIQKIISDWHSDLLSPKAINIEEVLLRWLPFIAYILHAFLIFGIASICGVLISEKSALLVTIILVALLRIAPFLRDYVTVSNFKSIGYYLKAAACVSAVIGMCMIVFTTPESVEKYNEIRPLVLPAAFVYWGLGAAVYIAGDILIRRSPEK